MKIRDYIEYKETELEDFEGFLQKLLGEEKIAHSNADLDEKEYEQLFEIMRKLYYD